MARADGGADAGGAAGPKEVVPRAADPAPLPVARRRLPPDAAAHGSLSSAP